MIQSAGFMPKDIENDPLAYTVYMNSDNYGSSGFAITS